MTNEPFLLRVTDVFSIPRGPLITGRIERGTVSVGMRVTVAGDKPFYRA